VRRAIGTDLSAADQWRHLPALRHRGGPGCLNNIIEQHPQVASELRDLLEEWMNDDPKLKRAPRSLVDFEEASADAR